MFGCDDVDLDEGRDGECGVFRRCDEGMEIEEKEKTGGLLCSSLRTGGGGGEKGITGVSSEKQEEEEDGEGEGEKEGEEQRRDFWRNKAATRGFLVASLRSI